MSTSRHAMMRRLRVLVAWAVVLWGAGMAAPPQQVEDTAIYAPRIAAARQHVRVRSVVPIVDTPRAEVARLPVETDRPIATYERGGQARIYLLHRALLL